MNSKIIILPIEIKEIMEEEGNNQSKFELYISIVQDKIFLYSNSETYICNLRPVVKENFRTELNQFYSHTNTETFDEKLILLNNLYRRLIKGKFLSKGFLNSSGKPLLQYEGRNPSQTLHFHTKVGFWPQITGCMYFIGLLHFKLRESKPIWMTPNFGGFYRIINKFAKTVELQPDQRNSFPDPKNDTSFAKIAEKGEWHCEDCGETVNFGIQCRCKAPKVMPLKITQFNNYGDIKLEIIMSCKVLRFLDAYNQILNQIDKFSGGTQSFFQELFRLAGGN